ncbi:MAG: hypothetical protein AB7V36_06105 [Bacteroidales bacterium]
MRRVFAMFPVLILFFCCERTVKNSEEDVLLKNNVISNVENEYSKKMLGFEYLCDSVYNGDFVFFDNKSQNDHIVWSQMQINVNNRKYHNHFLYCLDTISDYQNFICCAAEYFEKISPVPWGVFYGDCETAMKKKILPKEFLIVKTNAIRGASLIVNSCLFYTNIPYGNDPASYEHDFFYLYNNYWHSENEISDSIFKQMNNDIELLCNKYRDKSTLQHSR